MKPVLAFRLVLALCIVTTVLAICLPPQSPNSEVIPLKSSYRRLERVLHQCKEGYVSSEQRRFRFRSSMRYCLDNNQWSGTTPECERSSTNRRPSGRRNPPRPPRFGNGPFAPFSTRVLTFSSPNFARRNFNFCVRPPNPPFGRITTPLSRTTFFGNDFVTYECNSGYCLTGNSRSTCRSGRWTAPPTCRPCESCRRPNDPEFGRLILTNPEKRLYSLQECVTYECNPDRCMSGNARVCCGRDGWEQRPTCRRCCPQREPPVNGLAIPESRPRWKTGDVVLFACNVGFMMEGDRMARCERDGSWSNEVPQCKRCNTPRKIESIDLLWQPLKGSSRKKKKNMYHSYLKIMLILLAIIF